MESMNVGEAVIDALVENGITDLFGIPGKQTLPLNRAINAREDVRFTMARHETAVSHSAWGYAETSGEMAGTIVVPGPGDMNAMNGLKNALNDCTPLLHLAVETEPEIRGGDGIHETPPDTYDNVVKENVLVETPESTVAHLERAIAAARTPPKGPVRVGIPKNFLPMDVELAGVGEAEVPAAPSPQDRQLRRAADLLAAAARPVVVAGGGVRAADASDELRAVAERIEAPVVTTYKGKGTFPEDHDLSAGVLCGGASTELRRLIADADAALGVGTDFDAVATGAWSVDVPDRLVHVTLDPSDVGTGYEPTVGIVADARRTLESLDRALADRDVASDDGRARARDVRTADEARMADLLAVSEAPLTSVSALAAVREAAPRETVVSADAGGFRIWSLVSFPTYAARDYATSGSWATMGTGLPGAIGAKRANPDRPVVALVGDGGLMMAVHELHTLVAEDLDVTVVLLDNSDYAIISEEAERGYRMDPSEYGWPDAPIDFVEVAAGMGLSAARAETAAAVESEVAAAVEREGPSLVEVPTDPQEPQASEWMTD
jgi:acetolactate synthase-1/2/3 large subunit